MSATNRGGTRRENDVYLTCDWAIKRFLEAYTLTLNARVLDPCAAGGELLSVVKALRPDVQAMGVEIRPECIEDLRKVTGYSVTSDFLNGNTITHEAGVDYVLTNFPFSLAEEFLTKSMEIAPVVITLQRINWLRGNGREHMFRTLRPGLFVLPDRPSFDGRGTDASEYAWFVLGDNQVRGQWKMLGSTPKEERAAWNERMRVLNPRLEVEITDANA